LDHWRAKNGWRTQNACSGHAGCVQRQTDRASPCKATKTMNAPAVAPRSETPITSIAAPSRKSAANAHVAAIGTQTSRGYGPSARGFPGNPIELRMSRVYETETGLGQCSRDDA